MAAFLQRVAGSERKLLWLDDTDYSATLLSGGAAPWLDATAYLAWRRKAQSLLKADVIALQVARVGSAWFANNAQSRAAIGARNRANFPLKTALAVIELGRHVSEMLGNLRACFPDQILALVCPSPRAWVREAYCWAFGDGAEIEVGEQEVDAATLHVAGFLREFGGSGIDTVLLEESAVSEPANGSELDWYRSVLNVGAHYRWDMGFRLPGVRFVGGGAAGFDYVIGPSTLAAPCLGRVISENFWRGADLEGTAPGDFRYSHIPSGARPELVLDRLASLR